MMLRPATVALGAVLVLTTPAVAAAQTRRCSQVRPADWRRLINARGQEVMYFQDPVRLECTGQVVLEADSAVWNRATSDLELIGSVVYRDSATALTADWANYLGGEDRILSRGSVELTDLSNGSRVTGEQLDYQRQTATRPLSRMVVRGGRPYARIRRQPGEADGEPVRTTGAETPGVVSPQGRSEAAAGETPADTAGPLDVWADRLELLGDTLFLADRNVVLERGGMTGAADYARYDQVTEEMDLRGSAHVKNDRYRLEGEQINAFLEGEALREVISDRNARLISEDLTVRSDRLRIGFVEGVIERLEAWNPDPETAPHRAHAIAQDFDLRADSIDARADSGVIREVRAVGRAYGEREADSTAARLPAVVARDWIQGDTIIGYFAADTARPPPPPRVTPLTEGEDSVLLADAGDRQPIGEPGVPEPQDSTAVVLERVVVIGGGSPALSLYRMQSEDKQDAERSINFMKAAQIVLILSEGEVTRVEAEGPIEGLYLDPVTGQPRPAPEEQPPAGEGGA